MILAVNIGNTNIRAAVKDTAQLSGGKISQAVFYTRDVFDSGFFISETENGLGADIWGKISGSIVASVVPKNTEAVVCVLEEKTGKPVKRVNVRACGALKMEKYSGLLGDDRAVCCAMALEKFKPPFIVIDCGTATTVNAVDESGRFLGGAILTGLQTGLAALTGNTAQLPIITGLMENGSADISVIGGNTKDCMISGAVFGSAGALEGVVRRISEEIGVSPEVIVTGGHAPVILPHLTCEFAYEPSLLLDGLFYLSENEE
jgi:type III pantothenate kinase